MHKVVAVKVLEGYSLDLVLADGLRGMVGLSCLAEKGYSPWVMTTVYSVRFESVGRVNWLRERK